MPQRRLTWVAPKNDGGPVQKEADSGRRAVKRGWKWRGRWWRKKWGTVTVIWQINNNADLSKGSFDLMQGRIFQLFFFYFFFSPLFNVSPMTVRRSAKWTSCQMLRNCIFTWIQLSLDNCTFNRAFIESVCGRLPNGLVEKVLKESDQGLVILMLVLSLHSPISCASCD